LLRAVTLPVEHGGWGFLFEPVVLGLLLGPSWDGALVGLVALLGFLARHPLRLVLADRAKRVSYPRTALATRVAALELVLAGVVFGLLALRAPAAALALTLAVPAGLLQLAYDARGRSRSLLPELLGSMSLGVLATAVALAGGLPLRTATMLWLILALRALASVLYVRDRLRLGRGMAISPVATWCVHAGCVAASVGLALAGLMPRLAAVAFLVLSVRALAGLSRFRHALRPKTVGQWELVYGVVTVTLVAAGYALGI
jgi:hypothetical protein